MSSKYYEPSPYRENGLSGHEARFDRKKKIKARGLWSAAEVVQTKHKWVIGESQNNFQGRIAKVVHCQYCHRPKFAAEGSRCRAKVKLSKLQQISEAWKKSKEWKQFTTRKKLIIK